MKHEVRKKLFRTKIK